MTWGIFKRDSVSDTVEKLQKEGWDDMLKAVKDKQGTQPNGGSGKKQGTRYGGGKQKEDESDKRKEKNESVEQVTEAKEGDVVTINKPGHPLHGLKGHVFHSGKDHATVELHDKPKDYEWQSAKNVQIKHDELKVHAKNESVEVNEANEYKVYSNSHNNPEHHTKHSTLDSAKAELAKHKGGALYHNKKLYNKKTGMFESVEHIDEANEYKVYSNSHNNPEHHTKHSTLDSAKAELAKHNGGALYHKNKLYNKKTGMFESVELEQFDDEAFYDGSDMLGEAQARYSSSYKFTHKPGDEESEKKLADLKKSVKGTGKRVVLQGRLGKNNPNAHKYSKSVQGTSASASSGAHTHQRIQKADAAHHDVYVYDKADTAYSYDELISEVLSKNASAGKWISDFVKSDNPKFAGDSVEKRKERALAAYYTAQKNESTDYNFYAEYIEEAIQQDVVKMGAKEIKHANMKDKQQDAEIMEPHSEGEAAFLDKHAINVTDDPTAVKQDCGAGNQATAPKGQGAGSYDGNSKLSDKDKATVKEASDCKSGTTETGGKAETIDTKPKEKSTKKNSG